MTLTWELYWIVFYCNQTLHEIRNNRGAKSISHGGGIEIIMTHLPGCFRKLITTEVITNLGEPDSWSFFNTLNMKCTETHRCRAHVYLLQTTMNWLRWLKTHIFQITGSQLEVSLSPVGPMAMAGSISSCSSLGPGISGCSNLGPGIRV